MLVAATVFDAAQVGIGFYSASDVFTPGQMAGANMTFALLALGSRLVSQEKVSGNADATGGGA
ncbi:hypothetical protein [Methylobacterium pseudosasicola]|uniref:Uncharacterized protein n=1 Tax=Methylobacterium pseudosasicola TaxID=582667 RepID=A0A1I4QP91_9HYPH|nr:hypothetical protein [Methylobacterium pseudosasicola]SFM41530.1 hypothetical protein SAMN05192568_103081 [Methylobacterium pseudosasicola]